MRRILVIGIGVVLLVGLALGAQAADLKEMKKTLLGMATEFSPYVDDQGAIERPRDYRMKWVHLGSWVVPGENAPGYGFHDVYTQPDAAQAFRENGVFPDGAVLVKEIRTVETADMTTGTASWAGDPAVWFVMVKDRKNRFPGNPIWGEGWGWALFKSDNPEKNVASNFRKDCLPCHMPAKENDWVYLRGYPTLGRQVND